MSLGRGALVLGAVYESTAIAAAMGAATVAAEHIVVQAVIVAIYAGWRYRATVAWLRRCAAQRRPTPPARVILGYVLGICVLVFMAIQSIDGLLFVPLSLLGIALVVLSLLHTAAAVRIANQYQTAERLAWFAGAVGSGHPRQSGEK